MRSTTASLTRHSRSILHFVPHANCPSSTRFKMIIEVTVSSRLQRGSHSLLAESDGCYCFYYNSTFVLFQLRTQFKRLLRCLNVLVSSSSPHALTGEGCFHSFTLLIPHPVVACKNNIPFHSGIPNPFSLPCVASLKNLILLIFQLYEVSSTGRWAS